MAWETPKTDWHGERDANGVYFGDRFNATDFNRIKNNLQYLRDMAIALYDEFNIDPHTFSAIWYGLDTYEVADIKELPRNHRKGAA